MISQIFMMVCIAASSADACLWKFLVDFVLGKMTRGARVKALKMLCNTDGMTRDYLNDGKILFNRSRVVEMLCKSFTFGKESFMAALEALPPDLSDLEHFSERLKAKMDSQYFEQVMKLFVECASRGDDILLGSLGPFMPLPILNDALAGCPSTMVQRLVLLGAHPLSRFGWNRMIFVLDTNILMHHLDQVAKLAEHNVSLLVLPHEVPRELDAIHKRRGENSGLAQTALKFIDDHRIRFVCARTLHVRNVDGATPSNDDRIMQCAAYFASVGGDTRTTLLTADVALRVISAGNGIRVERAFSETVSYQQLRGDRDRDPMDVVQFLLSHDKMDASLIAEEWMPCQDAVLMLRSAKLHYACCHACTEEVHHLLDRGLIGLKQGVGVCIPKTQCVCFALCDGASKRSCWDAFS
jgi:PIN domain